MTASKNWQAIAEEAILDYFRTHNAEPFHSDDLWHVIPDQHRGVISLAVMALVNKKLIVGCGHRKSAIPSRKRSPSQEYRLTELGRDMLAGVSAGVASPQGTQGLPFPRSSASTDPGEDSSAATTGAAEETRPGCVVPLFEDERRPLSLVTDPEAA